VCIEGGRTARVETPIYPRSLGDRVSALVFRRIAVAIDGSRMAEAALETAIDLGKRYGASLTVVTVAPLGVYASSPEAYVPPEVIESEVQHYREILSVAVEKVQAAGLTSVNGVCLEGHVTDEIVAFLEKHPADLLVMGSRGLSTTRRLLLGSTSDAVLHHATCPVLIVRTGAEAVTPPPAPGPEP
jgi:nucleotide-binding universal stress UspA family protein